MSRSSTQFKMVLLGNSGAGKSSLVVRFVRDEYFDGAEATVGASFQSKIISLPDRTCKLEIWDTAGQERYRSLAPMYYRGSQAALVVFDLTSRDSYEGAKEWVKELRKKMAETSMVIALAGNKSDLESRRQVDSDEAALYARQEKLLYAETSAKTAANVEELFREIAMRVPATALASGPPRREINLDRPAGATSTGAAGGKCCG